MIAEPSVDHQFRPVEWKWAIKEHAQPAGSLGIELSNRP
jgi:hypothetical protein